MQKTTLAIAIAIGFALCLMPMASATDNANKNTVSSDTNTNQNLQIGMTNEKVTEAQKWLKEGNFYNRQVDGYFGIYTEKAVKQFQKAAGITEDGIVGPETLKAMKSWKQGKIKATSKKSQKTSTNKATNSASYGTKKKSTSKSYGYNSGSYSRYGGYINGMDCWAMSAYLSSKYSSQGYQTRTLHAKTSLSNDHRWVEVNDGSGWHAAPDYSSLPGIYNPTY